MPGFGNEFETEALPGALPIGHNSPQRCAYGLYAEQLSGSPFTAPRGDQRALLALPHPPVGAAHWGAFQKIDAGLWRTAPSAEVDELPIGQLRWDPVPIPTRGADFLTGMRTMTTAGDVHARPAWRRTSISSRGRWRTSTSTTPTARCCSCRSRARCGSFTEFGIIDVEPGEIAVIPRGVKFRVELLGRPGARLRVRELRRQVHAARPRPDRRQLPGQSARLPDARSRPSRTARRRRG